MSDQSGRVLVVEDDDALRRSVVLSLRRFGFEVMEAPNGAMGLELFAQQPVDAVVLDGKMPVMDGFETAKRLREDPRGADIPILLVTGMNEAQAIEQAYEAGASDFILKPVNLRVLSHRLKHLISRGRLKQELTSTRSTLEAFFETIPSAVIFCDANWNITECNPATESLFSWSKEIMDGLPLSTLFTDPAAFEQLKRNLEGQGALEGAWESELTNANETPFPGEILAAKVRSATEDRQAGYVLIITDATERFKARSERERTAKLDLLGILAGGIAHDFNNILTAIFSSVTLASLEVGEDSEAKGHLNCAVPALDQARRLASQLLTFSKGGEPVRTKADVGRILRQTVEFSLRGSKVAACFDIEGNQFIAEVDEGQFGQVISNLVVNASQAMANGGRLWVELSRESLGSDNDHSLPGGDYLSVGIRDEGKGIPKELLGKIFDPYFTTKPTGNGLGLATVLSIVKRHGGNITVNSVEDKGTLFTIYLPALADGAVDNVPQKPKFVMEPVVASAEPMSARSVLLLEDQDIIREAVTKLLEKANCEVCACDNGADAVEAYRVRPYDVVILDMTLPGGLSGLETFEQIKQIDPNVCGVVSTGYADDPVMAQPERYGFRAILPKPYTFGALKEVLASL